MPANIQLNHNAKIAHLSGKELQTEMNKESRAMSKEKLRERQIMRDRESETDMVERREMKGRNEKNRD